MNQRVSRLDVVDLDLYQLLLAERAVVSHGHHQPVPEAGPAERGTLIMRHFTTYARPILAGVALGIARDAIDSFRNLATAKTAALATGTLATQHITHERIGRAEALVRSGRAFLRETARGLPPSPD